MAGGSLLAQGRRRRTVKATAMSAKAMSASIPIASGPSAAPRINPKISILSISASCQRPDDGAVRASSDKFTWAVQQGTKIEYSFEFSIAYRHIQDSKALHETQHKPSVLRSTPKCPSMQHSALEPNETRLVAWHSPSKRRMLPCSDLQCPATPCNYLHRPLSVHGRVLWLGCN